MKNWISLFLSTNGLTSFTKIVCYKISLLFLLSFPLTSFATLDNPFFLSQGGAGGASIKEDFSYLLNPALIGIQRRTKGALAYSFKKKEQTGIATLADLKTKFPLAITYQRFWSKSFTKNKKDVLFVSSGFQIIPSLAIGFTVEKVLKKSLWDGSIGSVLKLGPQASLALFVNNILEKKDKNQKRVSFAVFTNWKQLFSSYLDLSRTADKEWIFKGSLEKSFFQNFLFIKIGGAWLSKEEKSLISGGVGLNSPKMSLEYSLQKEQESLQQAITLGVRI